MQTTKKLVSLALAAMMLLTCAGAFAEEKTFTATAEGKMGPVTVEVTFDGDAITSVTVTAQNETEFIAAGALELVPQAIVAAQSTEVEGVSGATVTGDAIKAAVGSCVEQAGVSLTAVEAAEEKTLNDGTYTASAHGHHSEITVEITVENSGIASVVIVSQDETVNIANVAYERIPAAIVAGQTVNVDMVTGATYTSRAIVSAVSDAIVQAGGNVFAFNTPVEKTAAERTAVTETYDVAVVGSGLAGISAALSAQEAGAKVVLIEKMPYIGGISQTAAGGVVYPIGEQQKKGFEEYLLNRNVGAQQGWMDTPNAIVSEANVHALAENAEAAVNWMGEQGVGMMFLEGISAEHYTLMAEDGTLVPTVNYVNCNLWIDAAAPNSGGIAINKMAANFKALGGVIYTEAPAYELITENGAVVGVKAASETVDYTFNAKNVILCAGGFGANEEYIAEHAPAYIGEVNTTLSGNTADGILMAEAIGAAVYEDAYMMGGSAQTVVTDLDMISPYTDKETPMTALYVNIQGIRVNSEDPEAYSNSLVYLNPDVRDYYWVVINEEVAGQNPEYKAILENGLVNEPDRFFTADSVVALAKKMRIVPNTLINTLDNYNYLCEKGEDTALFKNPAYLVAMTEGPWYAVKAYMQYFGTVGGVVTNEKAQVLDTKGNVIPGLYAAGENSNHGVFERCYSGGISLTEALTFGRIAGLDAAANK